MARLIKCPRCQSELDISSAAGGSTVRCTGCNSLVRVPSGSTNVTPAVPSVKVAPQKSTALFRKMAGARSPGVTSRPTTSSAVATPHRPRGAATRKSNTGLIAGISVGAIVIIVGALFLLRPKQEDPKKKPTAEKQAPVTNTYEEPAADTSKKSKTDNTGLQKTDKPVANPDVFEPGAEPYARKEPNWLSVEVDAATQAACDDLLKKGDFEPLKKEDYRFIKAIVLRFLSDDVTLTTNAFKAMSEICVKRKISAAKEGDPYKNPIRLDQLNNKKFRGGEYLLWADWLKSNDAVVRGEWKDGPKVQYGDGNADTANWEKILEGLRSGGEFDDPTRPGGMAIQQVKAMKRAGIVKLISFMDADDLPLLRSLVTAVNYLTGENKPLPNAGNKSQTKGEWELWLKTH